MLLLLSTGTRAAAPSAPPLAQLAQDPQWLKLIHYDPKAGRSDVLTAEFFASPRGQTDPAAELAATLALIESDQGLQSDRHGQCRFPARYRWLRQQLPALSPPQARCSAFHDWLDGQQVESLSLIYATGYLDNPASYYGHLLLRLNSRSGDRQGNLLDTSIDFGAIIPGQENPLAYIAKGLTGGYEAGFTEGTFYEQTRNYGDIELRDLWDYRLRLPPEARDLILAHLWELRRQKFTYYYLTENCAYRIVELLQLVTEAPVLSVDKGWVHPVDLIKRLHQARHRGVPLVAREHHLPSRQKRFYAKYGQLGPEQHQALTAVLEAPVRLTQPAYLALSAQERMGVVDTLFDYVELRLLQAPTPAHQESKRRLLQAMLQLSSAGEFQSPVLPAPRPPHQGQGSSTLRVAAARRAHADLLKLGFRGSYFDLLNLDTGRMPFSQLVMLDLQLEVSEEDVTLERLDLLNLRTYGLPSTGLPGDRRHAWHLRAGWDRPDLDCSDCTVASLEAGFGASRTLGEALAGNLSLGGRLAESTRGYGNLATTLSGELLFSPTPAYRARIRYSRHHYLDTARDREQFLLEQRFGSAPDWDIRLSYRKAVAEEVSAGVSLYF